MSDISETVRAMFESADSMGEGDNAFLDAVGMVLRREAHLAVERYNLALQAGVPEDTAQFLAQDDMGYQLAATVTRAWFYGKEADRARTSG